MNLGLPEILIILVVILLLFGSTRLPKLARSIGQASRELKQGMEEGTADDASRSDAKANAKSDDK